MKSELVRLLTFTIAVVHVHMFTKRIVRCSFLLVFCAVFVFVGVFWMPFVFVGVLCGVCFRGCCVRFLFSWVLCPVFVLVGVVSGVCFRECIVRFVFLAGFFYIFYPGCFLRCLFSFFFFFWGVFCCVFCGRQQRPWSCPVYHFRRRWTGS